MQTPMLTEENNFWSYTINSFEHKSLKLNSLLHADI